MRTTLLGMIVALYPAIVCAHAIVVAASPGVNARIAPGPLNIRLQFNSRIDLDRSRLTLSDPDGAERAVAISHEEAAGVLAGVGRATIMGPWKVRWQVLSVDGHITRGEIAFSVGDGN